MKKITMMVLIAVFALLVLYDVYAMSQGGTEASISSVIITYAYKMPMFVFTIGFICGHLFWRMRQNTDTKEIDEKKE